MRLRKIAIIACSMLAATFCATAALAEETTNTWWVAKEDPNAANTLDEGRGSEALPFRTIQAALGNPDFRVGDIVLVKRGDYDEGEYCLSGDYHMTNRVYISKTVHLKAVDGRDVTRIVGKWGKNGTSNSSTDGIRCIYVAAAAAGTEVEGFTLVNGYAYGSGAGGYNGSSYTRDRNFGGGIYVASKLKTVHVIDCAGQTRSPHAQLRERHAFVAGRTGGARLAGDVEANAVGIERMGRLDGVDNSRFNHSWFVSVVCLPD